MYRQTDKQKERLMEGWTEEGKGGHIDKHPSKKIDRQIDRQTDRWTDRQTDRQMEI
jgi:hypothetical protein